MGRNSILEAGAYLVYLSLVYPFSRDALSTCTAKHSIVRIWKWIYCSHILAHGSQPQHCWHFGPVLFHGDCPVCFRVSSSICLVLTKASPVVAKCSLGYKSTVVENHWCSRREQTKHWVLIKYQDFWRIDYLCYFNSTPPPHFSLILLGIRFVT